MSQFPVSLTVVTAALVASLGTAGCVNKSSNQAKVKGAEPVASPLCDGNPLADFMLMPSTKTFDSASFDWPALPPKSRNPDVPEPKRTVRAASAKEGVLLQVCLSPDYSQVTKLVRVAIRLEMNRNTTSETFSVSPSEPPEIKGVEKAIFGDPSELLIEASDARTETKIFLKGWANGGDPIVTAEAHYSTTYGDAVTLSPTLAGKLELGNPFTDYSPECGLWSLLRKKYVLGTATIRTRECHTFSDGMDMRLIRFLEVRVEDTNPALPGGKLERTLTGADVDLSKPQGERPFDFKTYHHGGFPWFYLNLPEATYAMMSQPVGAGGARPQYEIFFKDSQMIFGKYRTRYGTQPFSEPAPFSCGRAFPMWHGDEDCLDGAR